MKKYRVHLFPIIKVEVRVEADSPEEAMIKAMNNHNIHEEFNSSTSEFQNEFDGDGIVDELDEKGSWVSDKTWDIPHAENNEQLEREKINLNTDKETLKENDLVYKGEINISIGYDPENLNLEETKELYSEYLEELKSVLSDNEGSSLDNTDMVKLEFKELSIGKRKDLSMF